MLLLLMSFTAAHNHSLLENGFEEDVNEVKQGGFLNFEDVSVNFFSHGEDFTSASEIAVNCRFKGAQLSLTSPSSIFMKTLKKDFSFLKSMRGDLVVMP